MASLDKKLKKDIDKALKHLQKCDDFTTSKAEESIQVIWQSQTVGVHQVGAYLTSQGFGQLFGRMWSELSAFLEKDKWKQTGFSNLDFLLNTYLNCSDVSPELSKDIGKSGSIPAVFAGIQTLDKYFDNELKFKIIKPLVENILFLLCNIVSRCSSNRKVFQKAHAFAIFEKYLKSENGLVSLLSLMILAYVVDESESSILASSGGGVATLVNWLQRAVDSATHRASRSGIGGSASEILDCLNHLAVNDSNKVEIEKEGGIPTIVRMLHDGFNEQEQCLAATAVWNLTFVESIRQSSQLQDAVPFLDILRKSSNRDLRNASAYAFWEINNNRQEDLPPRENIPEESPPSYEESIQESGQATTTKPAKVMISYQWDYQETAENIRDLLCNKGYRIWMDVTHMRDDILSSMAAAVEECDVMLIFMSETYKNSQSCRTEAEYAYKLQKKIIPLLVERDYKPDGWLGALLGMKLYYKAILQDFTKTDFAKLLVALGEIVKERKAHDEQDGPIQASQSTPIAASPAAKVSTSNPPASDWTEDDVQAWLKKSKLEELCETLESFEGRHLQKLYSDYCRDPKEFKNEMRTDYQINSKMCLKFSVALEKLFQN